MEMHCNYTFTLRCFLCPGPYVNLLAFTGLIGYTKATSWQEGIAIQKLSFRIYYSQVYNNFTGLKIVHGGVTI